MKEDIAYTLFSEEQIQARVRELGEQITRDYQGKEPVFICVLKGSAIFMADLIRHVDLKATMDFMQVSSYGGGTRSSGVVKIVQDLSHTIEGRDVIVVEDILDSGITLSYLAKLLKGREPASLKIVTLLDKPDRRIGDVYADYIGFTVPNAFVVGYGLDYDQNYRNLPYVGVLKPEIYTN